jgi:hypothetical protein
MPLKKKYKIKKSYDINTIKTSIFQVRMRSQIIHFQKQDKQTTINLK